MAIIDPQNIADSLAECAELYVLPRYQALKEHEISTKTGPNDLVTQADLDVEEHLKRVLPGFLPGSVVVGEESVARGEDSLDVLHEGRQAIWIVDPVDGTRNFVNGNPDFGVMLACVIDGAVQYGWIYDVIARRMHIAERGAGAFVGGARLAVRNVGAVGDMIAHINTKFFPKPIQADIKSALQCFKNSHAVGSAAHEYTRIAAGQADISLYSRLKPWDHLPGALIVEEAGGYVGKWDKTPYTPRDYYAGLIVATSKENWETVYNILFSNPDLHKYI